MAMSSQEKVDELLIGRTIVSVKYMHPEDRYIEIHLSDGHVLAISPEIDGMGTPGVRPPGITVEIDGGIIDTDDS